MVDDGLGEHPTAASEAVANCTEVTVFETLDHHELHDSQCTFRVGEGNATTSTGTTRTSYNSLEGLVSIVAGAIAGSVSRIIQDWVLWNM